MMKDLNLFEAVNLVQHEEIKQIKYQEEKLEEFLSSNCDMFTSDDWLFYTEATGKSLQWLKINATYLDTKGANGTMLDNAISDGDYELGSFYI